MLCMALSFPKAEQLPISGSAFLNKPLFVCIGYLLCGGLVWETCNKGTTLFGGSSRIAQDTPKLPAWGVSGWLVSISLFLSLGCFILPFSKALTVCGVVWQQPRLKAKWVSLTWAAETSSGVLETGMRGFQTLWREIMGFSPTRLCREIMSLGPTSQRRESWVWVPLLWGGRWWVWVPPSCGGSHEFGSHLPMEESLRSA